MMFFHHIYHLNRRHEHFFNQGKVLGAILLKGSMTQNELLKIVDSGTLDELEKRTLIKRENCAQSGMPDEGSRGTVFSLTKKGKLFARRFQNFNRRAERFLRQGKVLSVILRKGPATQSELIEIVDRDQQQLSETLAELENQKSIKRGRQRENNAEDTYSDVFSLTKTGEMMARRFQIHDLFTRNISESMSDEEKKQLTAIIEKLRSNTGGEEFSHFHFRGSHFGFGGTGSHHHGPGQKSTDGKEG
jgi:DNA-binding MarR family transcriptional regulator